MQSGASGAAKTVGEEEIQLRAPLQKEAVALPRIHSHHALAEELTQLAL